MATRNEKLLRAGRGIKVGAMIVGMIDSNSTGADDKAASIAQKIGDGFERAGEGDLKSGAGVLRVAARELNALADDMDAGRVST